MLTAVRVANTMPGIARNATERENGTFKKYQPNADLKRLPSYVAEASCLPSGATAAANSTDAPSEAIAT
jgi:hypothetical protein